MARGSRWVVSGVLGRRRAPTNGCLGFGYPWRVNRSGRGRWERVIAARQRARDALGQAATEHDPYEAPSPKRTARQIQQPARLPYTEGVAVLSLGEAAGRLGVSRDALEAMIAAGKVRALRTGFTWTVPTSEIERTKSFRDPVTGSLDSPARAVTVSRTIACVAAGPWSIHRRVRPPDSPAYLRHSHRLPIP